MHARHGSAIFQASERGRALNPHLLRGHAYILAAPVAGGKGRDKRRRRFPSTRLHNTAARNVRERKRMLKLSARAFHRPGRTPAGLYSSRYPEEEGHYHDKECHPLATHFTPRFQPFFEIYLALSSSRGYYSRTCRARWYLPFFHV